MRRNTLTIGTALAAALLVAGCSSTTTGSPSSTTATTGDSSSSDLNGAPHVTAPLDTTKFQSNTCGSITSAQLAELNIGTVSAGTQGVTGPTCTWKTGGDGSKSTAVVTYVTSGNGLSTIYGRKSEYAVFQVLSPIDGYPVVYAPEQDNRAQGTCQLAVGVSDNLVVAVGLSVNSGQYKSDPCTPNQQLAADVISNIKNGG